MSFLGLICKAACAAPDPETVRVDDAAPPAQQKTVACHLIEEKRSQQQQELERQRRAAEEAEARLRAAEEEQERRRAEERRRVEEEQEARRAEEARRADSERLAELARRAEEQRARQQERDKKINVFLQQHGFASVTAPRRSYLKTKYVIHSAAKRGDAELLEMLLEAGAEVTSRDSKGKTAYQVAQALDKAGSHREALEVLARQPEAVKATPACVGGA